MGVDILINKFYNVSTMTRDQEKIREMQSMRMAGSFSLRAIGAYYGISRERVRQLLGNTGRIKLADRVHQPHPKAEQRKKIALDLLCYTNSELTEVLGVCEARISSYRRDHRHAVEASAPMRIGLEGEELISSLLSERGIQHKLMPHGWPYDILLHSGTRVDVKTTSREYALKSGGHLWQFKLKSKKSKLTACDFYVCIILPLQAIFVIPATEFGEMTTVLGMCYPQERRHKRNLQRYLNRFDLLAGEGQN